ncbi:MAG: tetratricopeptide repeat protein [Gammaproteobacteria bacterium]|nr:MAG: tetratricopeptide repeat protein [Gammaproteobacteria bacterium]
MCVKKNLFGIAKSVSFVVALTTGLTTVTAVLSPVAMAAEKPQQLSAKMKPLGDAQKLMAEKKWKEALAVINEKVVPVPGKSAYEEAVTNEFKSACLMQLKDYAGVAKVYETMLAANQVPADQINQRTITLAELYLSQGDYAKGIETYERYLKTNPATPDVTLGLTQAYFKKGDYKNAAEYAQKLIKQAEAAKKPVDKNWLQMLGYSYSKLGNNAAYADVLGKLLELYPSPEYWNDMLKITRNEVTFSDREKIEYFRLKKTVGSLTAEEYNELAELSLSLLDSGDAKAALEAGISAGVVPASERTNKLLARAKADAAQDLASIDATAKEAASKPTGEPLAKIGAAYLGHGLNDKAISSIQSAIAKGGLTSIDESYVRLGVANLNIGKKAEAIKAFQSVSDKSNLARVAKLWTLYAKK